MIPPHELNLTHGHRVSWVEVSETGSVSVECQCGEQWQRYRLADAAVAHERHQLKIHTIRKAA